MPRHYDLRERELVAYLQAHPGALTSRVRAAVYPDVSRRTAYRRIDEAERACLILHTGCVPDATVSREHGCPNHGHHHLWAPAVVTW